MRAARRVRRAGRGNPPGAIPAERPGPTPTVIPKKAGGPTSLANLRLLCRFHHLICVHRWGWQLTAHGGGMLEARSPDGSIVYRSHAPPATPAA